MHAIFEVLPRVGAQLEQIENAILAYDVGVPTMEIEGTQGQLKVVHQAEREYSIEWYVIVEDDADGRPGRKAACVTLVSEDNWVELVWDLGAAEFSFSTDLPDADGVMDFVAYFQEVFGRASRTCSLDEGFEIIKAMAALVAKG